MAQVDVTASKQKRESAGHHRYAAGIDILSATSHNKKGSAIEI